MTHPIAVGLPDGQMIELDLATWQWSADSADAETYANLANCILYDYSPADGQPGYRLAQLVAEQLGGKAILPPLPPGEEGVLH